MRLEVSVGEAIDKLSILEIKLSKITDEQQRNEIQKEINALSECLQHKHTYEFYYNILMYVNERIWTMTDDIKQMTPNDPSFAHIANKIFEFNQKRFRIKTRFNLLTSSNIKEQKSYAASHCQIDIDSEDTFFKKVPEIHYLSIEYDVITFSGKYLLDLNKADLDLLPLTTNVLLSEFSIPSEVPRTLFEDAPLAYLVGGMFGDFIQCLSIISEVYYNTGRKGILYIGENSGEPFLNGVQNTYNDTYPVIINQPYIHNYQIFNSKIHYININLTNWRTNANIFYQNWYHTFNQTYGIKWGAHKWLNVEYDEKWKNRVVINTTVNRFANNIDFSLLKTMYQNDLLFISAKDSTPEKTTSLNHAYFEKTANISIEYHEFASFSELTTIINSCKLFVGSLSAPLSIAHALHKPRICGFYICDDSNADYRMNVGLDAYLPNLRYKI